jgi:hypothetical protein
VGGVKTTEPANQNLWRSVREVFGTGLSLRDGDVVGRRDKTGKLRIGGECLVDPVAA